MNKISILLILSLAVVTGCAQRTSHGTGTRTGVFEEVNNGGGIPKGFADLRIESSFKTHKPGAHSLPDAHGTEDYKFYINIDGQEMLLPAKLTEEYSEPAKLMDPEAGDGMRYGIFRSIRLSKGVHKLTVTIPDDEVVVKREIKVAEGTVNELVLEPIYSGEGGKKRDLPYLTSSYRTGISSIRVFLNGEEIRK